MTVLITKPWAVYNEIEEYAADWIENLIALGVVAPGVVDRRSIEDVRPDDYRGFRQVHLFAGIGVWSYALRRAGFSDDTEIWTGSAPCQPFSAAGKGAGVDDERHLWPAFYHLICECRPGTIFGEQVASKDGLAWLDLIQTDLEEAGYACWPVDTCSAGSGAPHLRQRLRFAAEDLRSSPSGLARSDDHEWGADLTQWGSQGGTVDGGSGQTLRLADDAERGRIGGSGLRHPESAGQRGQVTANSGSLEWLDDAQRARLEGYGRDEHRPQRWSLEDRSGAQTSGDVRLDAGTLEQLADTGCGLLQHRERSQDNAGTQGSVEGETQQLERCGPRCSNSSPDDELGGHDVLGGQVSRIERPGPTNGFWRVADWLFGRDGKWRPVSPCYVEMVDGPSASVGRGGTFVEDEEDAETRLQAMLDTFGEEEIQRQAGRSWSLREEGLLRPFLHGGLDGRSNQELKPEEQPQAVCENCGVGVRDLWEDEHKVPCASCGPQPFEQRCFELEDIVCVLPQSLALAELRGRRADARQLRLLREAINEAGAMCDPLVSGNAAWASLSEDAQNRIRMGFDVGAWRRVVSFPLVDGSAFKPGSGHPVYEGKSRQGMLKGYGNAIDAEATVDFLTAFREGLEDRANASRAPSDDLFGDLIN